MNGQTTNVDLFIKIEAVNQHAPKFEKEVYVFHITEHSSYNSTVGVVLAIDLDSESEIFGKVIYKMVNIDEWYLGESLLNEFKLFNLWIFILIKASKSRPKQAVSLLDATK